MSFLTTALFWVYGLLLFTIGYYLIQDLILSRTSRNFCEVFEKEDK